MVAGSSWTRRAVAVAAALTASLLVASCAATATSSTGNKGYVAGDGSVKLYPPGQRPQVPDLKGPLLGGGDANLASYRGKVVVLNLWGSWCAECREETPDLNEAARELKGAVFLGIDTRDNNSAALAFVHANHVPYRSFDDPDGSLLLSIQKAVLMDSLPSTIVLDKQGQVAVRVNGTIGAVTLEEMVRPLERQP